MKNKRALILASVASMIQQFNLPNIYILLELGYEVHVACNYEVGSTCSKASVEKLKQLLDSLGVLQFQIDFKRNVYDIKADLQAYQQVKKLLSSHKYQILHCHSPIGGIVGRLAAHKFETKVIYTAHGFHFYKGAPLINWILYYPIEKFCSYFTDVLITINHEDYQRAQHKMHAKRTCYIPGIGVDLEKIAAMQVDKATKRKELGISESSIVLLSVGELSKRKNHQAIIKALALLKNDNIHYFIAGKGPLQKHLITLAEELGVAKQVHLLGFRTDIIELNCAADIFCLPSIQEGLPVALMEAMACSLPVACSRIRGNMDLIDKHGGVLFDPKDIEDVRIALHQLLSSDLSTMGKYSSEQVKSFSLDKTAKKVRSEYILGH